jgi:hypothetical protein
MAIKQTNISPLHGPPKFTQIGIFGLQTNHLATLTVMQKMLFLFCPGRNAQCKCLPDLKKTCNRRHQSLKGLSIQKKSFLRITWNQNGLG